MMHHKGLGRFVTEDWHEFRQEARLYAHSEEEFSEIEQTRYDLDTAQIDGSDTIKRPINEPYSEDAVNVEAHNPRR